MIVDLWVFCKREIGMSSERALKIFAKSLTDETISYLQRRSSWIQRGADNFNAIFGESIL